MDDIMTKLSQALSDPQTMAQVNSLMNTLAAENSQPQEGAGSTQNSPDMAKLMQISTLLSGVGKDDKNIAFLGALKPLLSDENKLKTDRLIKIFRIMAAYPILRDSGLLGGDLFG